MFRLKVSLILGFAALFTMLPTVVQGSAYKLKYPSKSVWLEVPFTCEAGDFVMEFTYIPN